MTDIIAIPTPIIHVVTAGTQGPAGPPGSGSGNFPAGGIANQVLFKTNATDYAADWRTLVSAQIADLPATIDAALINASILSPVNTTDTIPVIRGGIVYLATVASILAASSVSGTPGQLNFSLAVQSGLLGVI